MVNKLKHYIAKKKYLKKNVIIVIVVTTTASLFTVFATKLALAEIVKLKAYNSHIDKVRIFTSENNFNEAKTELKEAKKMATSSTLLFKIKRTELWMLDELNKLYKEKSDKTKDISDQDNSTNEVESEKSSNKNDLAEQNNTTNEEEVIQEPECPAKSDRYTTIVKLEDSLGNVFTHSAHNDCAPAGGYYSAKIGDSLTIKVSVNNDISDPVQYQFNGHGFPNTWQTSNEATIKFDGKYETNHFQVFVKNSDDQFRAPNYDDMIQVYYTTNK